VKRLLVLCTVCTVCALLTLMGVGAAGWRAPAAFYATAAGAALPVLIAGFVAVFRWAQRAELRRRANWKTNLAAWRRHMAPRPGPRRRR
jgi:hypothetical protein